MISEVGGYRDYIDRSPDYELELTLRVGDLPLTIKQMMQLDTLYFPPGNYLLSDEIVIWRAPGNP